MNAIFDYIDGCLIGGEFEVVAEAGDVKLGYFTIKEECEGLTIGDRIAMVYYGVNDYFTTSDWQDRQPDMTDPEKVARQDWIFMDGKAAVVVDGLPRVFPR